MVARLEIALQIYAARLVGKCFQWGSRDCNTIILDWLNMATGDNSIKEIRGRYESRAGAIRYQLQYGRDLPKIIKDAGGYYIPRNRVTVGDIILTKETGAPWECGHLVLGSRYLGAAPGRGVFLGAVGVLPDNAKAMRLRYV